MDFSKCVRCLKPLPSGRFEFLSKVSGKWEDCIPGCAAEGRNRLHRHKDCKMLSIGELRKKICIENDGSLMTNNLDILTDIVQKHISKEFFLGGSHRFGWARSDSDFDIFLPPPAHQVMSDFHLLIAARSNYYVQGWTHYEAIFFNTPVDFIVAGSDSLYFGLRTEHNRVAAYLKRHPIIVQQARLGGQRGKQLYRWVLSLIDDMKVV